MDVCPGKCTQGTAEEEEEGKGEEQEGEEEEGSQGMTLSRLCGLLLL